MLASSFSDFDMGREGRVWRSVLFPQFFFVFRTVSFDAGATGSIRLLREASE